LLAKTKVCRAKKREQKKAALNENWIKNTVKTVMQNQA
jgi:hypothetical protein